MASVAITPMESNFLVPNATELRTVGGVPGLDLFSVTCLTVFHVRLLLM